MKIHDLDTAAEDVFKHYFVRQYGDIDLFAISQRYALTPTTSCSSSSIWAQSLANYLRVKVAMKVESRPAILTGATFVSTRVFEPIACTTRQ
jgi:hypothetical protein